MGAAGSTVRDDEHAAFERPRGRSRPRTKDRPRYDDAAVATVVTIDRGRYSLVLNHTDLTAVKAQSLGRRAVVVGDRVRVVGDLSGAPDTLARIVQVEPRRSELRRTADDNDPYERVIIANADQLIVVTSLAEPPPKIGLIDRCLAAAYAARIDPLVILTKSDLAAPGPMVELLSPLDVPTLVVHRNHDVHAVRSVLTGRTSVLVGHSGVGKSTLVNSLIQQSSRAVGAVNQISGRGRHTSTSAHGFLLPSGGWVFDTPGIRSFGLAHVTADEIIASFSDLTPVTADCPRGCTHRRHEPDCQLDVAVRSGAVGTERVAGLRRILAGKGD